MVGAGLEIGDGELLVLRVDTRVGFLAVEEGDRVAELDLALLEVEVMVKARAHDGDVEA